MYKNKSRQILNGYLQNKQYYEQLTSDLSDLKEKESKLLNNGCKFNPYVAQIGNLSERANKVETEINRVLNIINSLEQPSRNILYLKFVKSFSNTNIAIKLNYSLPRIYQLLNKALSEFAEKYDDFNVV